MTGEGATVHTSRFSWVGIALIVAGVVLLLGRLELVDFSWTTALWMLFGAFAAKKAIEGFAANKRGRLFFGTFVFLFSLVRVFEAFDVFHLYHYLMFPGVLLMLGSSFLMLFLHAPREWNVLIPATFLLGLGSAIMLVESGYLYRRDVLDAVGNYWPVVFILFGISLLSRRRSLT